MLGHRKGILTIILGIVIMMFSVPVFASPEVDLSRKGSITLTMKYSDSKKPVTEGQITIYKVADYNPAANSEPEVFRFTGEFKGCGMDVVPTSSKGAVALQTYAVDNKIKGTSKNLNKKGTVEFDDLPVGLYLVAQVKKPKKYIAIRPFLISVPQNVDGEYIYDVDATPKLNLNNEDIESSTPVQRETTTPAQTTTPAESETTKPSNEPPLPKTGQLWWPVPVLVVAGMMFILWGMKRKADGRAK